MPPGATLGRGKRIFDGIFDGILTGIFAGRFRGRGLPLLPGIPRDSQGLPIVFNLNFTVMAFFPTDAFLDKFAPITDYGSKIPHWYQPGKLQFVTIRLADSLPPPALEKIKNELSLYEQALKVDEDNSRKLEIHYRRLLQEYLDRGYGDCILRDGKCRKVIVEAINFYKDMECYDLVIMPNHLHFLAAFSSNHKRVIENIKHYTARVLNRYLQKSGAVWQERYWDRMIRNERHLLNTRAYIYANPKDLPREDYTLVMGGKEV